MNSFEISKDERYTDKYTLSFLSHSSDEAGYFCYCVYRDNLYYWEIGQILGGN
jgi:hypothetical protein